MTPAALPLLILWTLVQAEIPVGTQLTYEGSFVAEKGDLADAPKRFTLVTLSANEPNGQSVWYWTLREDHGGWPWLFHFGKLGGDTVEASDEPALRYERQEGIDAVRLFFPRLLREGPLMPDASWMADRLEYRVTGSAPLQNMDTWQIEGRNAYGVKRTVWVDKPTATVVGLRETVFLGQGEKHELRYALASRSTLDEAALSRTIVDFETFLALRSRLKIPAETREIIWTEERLTALREHLPALLRGDVSEMLTQVAKEAEANARDQRNQANSVGVLRERLVGRDAPKPRLIDAREKEFDWSQLADKVTVLHFWEYRESPLEEPYGQTAYLDYLLRQHASQEVQIFGVAVNPQLRDEQSRRRAILSGEKLRSFMNLSYPLLFDAEEGIKQFGDPRVAGAKLPLFVVVGRNGKVLHYHAGHYEVERDRGLQQLESVVKAALDNRE